MLTAIINECWEQTLCYEQSLMNAEKDHQWEIINKCLEQLLMNVTNNHYWMIRTIIDEI